MIEAVLWDVGGVFTGSPIHGLYAYADTLGVDREAFLDWVLGYTRVDCDHAWHRLERGEVSFEFALEACGALASQAGVTIDRRDLMRAFGGGERGPRESVIDKVRELKERGFRHGIITNNVREFADGWRRMFPVDELFEVVLDSSQLGMRKPGRAIYSLALERLNLPGERVVFLDDYEPNVQGARAVGMHGIVVGLEYAAALDELDELVTGG